METYDFSAWVTKYNTPCTDGNTILHGAFEDDDGRKVPLVWNHQHNSVSNILGHVILKHHDEGVRGYAKFNDTTDAKKAQMQVAHGDIDAVSIFANHIQKTPDGISHGAIKEVSLVLAGANPGALIDEVLCHSDDPDSVQIYTDEKIELAHADKDDEKNQNESEEEKPEEEDDEIDENSTIEEVIATMNEPQLNAMYYLIGMAVKDAEDKEKSKENKEEENSMSHNVFDKDAKNLSGADEGTTISQSDIAAIFEDANRLGSLKASCISHSVTDISNMFSSAKSPTEEPIPVTKNEDWVSQVIKRVKYLPFARVKNLTADLTTDAARAKGYVTGAQKAEEVVAISKRETTPTTVYKLQKLNRDDLEDITDFDVVKWLKEEMRGRLNAELARAYLIGDGRNVGSADKINESNIRPIWTDNDLFSVKVDMTPAASATAEAKAKQFVKTVRASRKLYQGTGSPVMYIGEDILSDVLCLEDTLGRLLYPDLDALAKVLRVSEIISVPVMSGVKRVDNKDTYELCGIMVDLKDYGVGQKRMNNEDFFSDFDLDYNKMEYLIETRKSGALMVPHSAVVFQFKTTEG